VSKPRRPGARVPLALKKNRAAAGHGKNLVRPGNTNPKSRNSWPSLKNYAFAVSEVVQISGEYFLNMDSIISTTPPAVLFGRRIMQLTRPRQAAEPSIVDQLAAITDPLERTHFIRENKKELADFVQLPPETHTLSAILVTEFKQLNPSLSQSEIAELLSCSPQMISDVLAGRRQFAGGTLLALSRLAQK
jgi:hypothetical protein